MTEINETEAIEIEMAEPLEDQPGWANDGALTEDEITDALEDMQNAISAEADAEHAEALALNALHGKIFGETVDETTPVDTSFSPFELRAIRESHGLSRNDVVEATGLSLSVVWRSEQEDKTITPEIYGKLVEFYENTPDKVKATKKAVKVECDHAPLQAALNDFGLFLAAVLDTAKEKKQATGALKEILVKFTDDIYNVQW